MSLNKSEYEFVMDLLNSELKRYKIDSNMYFYIENIYDELNAEYESLIEDDEDSCAQCLGCGADIIGGRICRDCSGV